ncbi:MAG: hypothetical protein ACFFE8_02230 [Candidatus Heimdallarchaeota archaeon]
MDLVFSAFDEKVGPIAIFSTIEDPILTKIIAAKSIISAFRLVDTSTSHPLEGEVIIPFPQEKKVVFIYCTELDQKTNSGDRRMITLSAVVDQDQNNQLYSKASELSRSAAEIRDILNTNYAFGQPLSQHLMNRLEEWSRVIP